MMATLTSPLVDAFIKTEELSPCGSSVSSPDPCDVSRSSPRFFPCLYESVGGYSPERELSARQNPIFVPLSSYGHSSNSESPPSYTSMGSLANEDDHPYLMPPGMATSVDLNEEERLSPFRSEDYGNLSCITPSYFSMKSAPIVDNGKVESTLQESAGTSSEMQEAPVPSECARCGRASYRSWWLSGASHTLCDSCCVAVAPPRVPETNNTPPAVAKPKPKTQRRSSNAKKNQNQVCSNCETTQTTLWRRDSSSNTVCNACGLFFKLRGYERPKTMRKDTIQKRKRKPRSPEQRRKNSPARPKSPAHRHNVVQKSSSPSTNSNGSDPSLVQLLDLSGNTTVQSLPSVHSPDGFPNSLHHFGNNGTLQSSILPSVFNGSIINYHTANGFPTHFQHCELLHNFPTSTSPLQEL